MKRCLLLIGLALLIGGGMYGWWWVQPIRQMATLSQADHGPAWASEEMYQKYPELAYVQEHFAEEIIGQSGGTVHPSQVVNEVYEKSFLRVFYGASLMLTGLLAVLCSWRLVFVQRRASREVGQGKKEPLAPNQPSAAQPG
ncbi:MAG: hypothetical protein MK108_01885 [Mariniblastus sp.]|nr:hypothetical protein [Mariniblastus sp.]